MLTDVAVRGAYTHMNTQTYIHIFIHNQHVYVRTSDGCLCVNISRSCNVTRTSHISVLYSIQADTTTGQLTDVKEMVVIWQ